ncbi:MAG TPA: hypothetical protein VNJ01_18120 [Bacteriovoracaceae bacterium]|nr:hypothetical protein [Bacteriovoracaceae bacterium]
MTIFRSCLLILLVLPQYVCAQDFLDRVRRTYLETDGNFDLECQYSRNQTFKVIRASTATVRAKGSMSREFVIETTARRVPLKLTLTNSNGAVDYQISINGAQPQTGRVTDREIKLAPLRDTSLSRDLEVEAITCQIHLASAHPYPLKKGKYHFSVHPHTIYDNQARLKNKIEKYLNDPSYRSVIFLDTDNFRGNLVDLGEFLGGQVPQLPQNDLESDLAQVPAHIPLVVSPAGNNRFTFDGDGAVEIIFSGGNHNYCIWNNTRQVLMSLLNSNSKARVTFRFDLNSIVAQKSGMEELDLSFESKAIDSSNLLKDLLANRAIQERYHFSWLVYFRNLLAQEYAGMYQTFSIKYSAPGYQESFLIEGTGHRKIEVEFQYF